MTKPAKPAKRAATKGKPVAKKPEGPSPELVEAMSALPVRRQRFVREYGLDFNATQAAIRAGFSAHSAAAIGHELLRFPDVKAAVDILLAERARRVEATADIVLRELVDLATADPRELTEVRVVCCRCCWGINNRYQYTEGQWQAAQDAYNERVQEHGAKKAGRKPDPKGGTGYDAKRDPNPECPECFGLGHPLTVVKNTRDASSAAARLFAGVEQTKDGIKVKLRDQDAALVNLGRHLKMFTDNFDGTLKVDAIEDFKQFLAKRGGSRLPIKTAK